MTAERLAEAGPSPRLRQDGALELSAGRLYALGGELALDGRTSWVPNEVRGYQAHNCYLLIEVGGALLIDTGVAPLAGAVLSQLSALIETRTPLTVFLTRAELDCYANLSAISSQFNVVDVYAGGAINPFDAFDAAAARADKAQVHRIEAGGHLPAPPSQRVQILAPPLRLLATFWLYDEVGRALFTSDSFAYMCGDQSRRSRYIDSTDAVDPARAKAIVEAKFWYFPLARALSIQVALRALVERLDIQFIAPGRGAIIGGRKAVRDHFELMASLLPTT